MRKSNDVLRVQGSQLAEAGKGSEPQTDDYFRERAARADVDQAKKLLKRAGRGTAAVAGDEIG